MFESKRIKVYKHKINSLYSPCYITKQNTKFKYTCTRSASLAALTGRFAFIYILIASMYSPLFSLTLKKERKKRTEFTFGDVLQKLK